MVYSLIHSLFLYKLIGPNTGSGSNICPFHKDLNSSRSREVHHVYPVKGFGFINETHEDISLFFNSSFRYPSDHKYCISHAPVSSTKPHCSCHLKQILCYFTKCMFLLVHSIDIKSQNFNNSIAGKVNIQLECHMLYDCLINSQPNKAIISAKDSSNWMILG